MRNFSQLLKEEYVAPAESPVVAMERETAKNIASVIGVELGVDAKRFADGIVAIRQELFAAIDNSDIKLSDILNLVKANHEIFELAPEATAQIIVKYIHKIYFELRMLQVESNR
jgi:hypothetical protein